MRWMKGWTYEEYLDAPPEIVDEIIRIMNEEQEYWALHNAGH